MTLLSIVCMRIWFARMYDRYDINIRIVTEIWSMSTKESPDHVEESGDAAPGSWRMSWSVMAARWAAVRVSSLFVSIMERSLTISPRDRLKPHAAYLIIADRSIKVQQLPSPLLSQAPCRTCTPPPGLSRGHSMAVRWDFASKRRQKLAKGQAINNK